MITHGSDTGYTYYKCRCDLCRQAHNEAKADRRAYYRDPANYDPEAWFHGLINGYRLGCSCADCKEAGRIYRKEMRYWR